MKNFWPKLSPAIGFSAEKRANKFKPIVENIYSNNENNFHFINGKVNKAIRSKIELNDQKPENFFELNFCSHWANRDFNEYFDSY